jgi:hypothetical protein
MASPHAITRVVYCTKTAHSTITSMYYKLKLHVSSQDHLLFLSRDLNVVVESGEVVFRFFRVKFGSERNIRKLFINRGKM